MTISQWLKQAEAELQAAGIGTARLDVLILLEDVTELDRAKLLAEPELPLPATQQTKLAKLLNRRTQHEPIAYIRGHTEFYGRTFVITPAVLEPRPESETMIDQLKALVSGPGKPPLAGLLDTGKLHIADVGTGSGALGITAKLELPKAQVDLLEVDPAALKIAKTNVDKFTLGLPTIKADLLAPKQPLSAVDYDLLLCNLPYVPDNYSVNEAAAQEPKIAIFGGPDGLDLYHKLFDQLKSRPKRPLFILTESLPPQHERLAALAAQAGYQLHQADDFIQVFASDRVASLKSRPQFK
jgi:release factor glutamine methyltransferase